MGAFKSPLTFLVVCFQLLRTSFGGYNQVWCEQTMMMNKNPDPVDIQMHPYDSFPDNFYVTEEVKYINYEGIANTVANIELYYSQSSNRAFMDIQTLNYGGKSWMVPKANTEYHVGKGANRCVPARSSSSLDFQMMGVQNGSLGPPAHMMELTTGIVKKKIYTNEAYPIPDRGMNGFIWQFCNYEISTDATHFTQWYFVEPSLAMPGRPNQPVAIMMDRTTISGLEGITPNDPNHYRKDFTRFLENITPETDSHFELDPSDYCYNTGKKVYDIGLPDLPGDFQVKIEVKTVSSPGTANLDYYVMTHLSTVGLHVLTTETATNHVYEGGPSVTWVSLVYDFNTQNMYTLDLLSATCRMTALDPQTAGGAVVVPNGDGTYRMADTARLFDLDQPQLFHYMGKERLVDREMITDLFAAYKNTTKDDMRDGYHQVYFTNADWMKQVGFKSDYVLPVRREVKAVTGITKTYNYFHLTDNLQDTIPDISSCFAPNQTVDVQIIFPNSYQTYVGNNRDTFKGYLHLMLTYSLTQDGTAVSPLRFAGIDITPSPSDQIVARFKIVNARTKAELSAEQIFSHLKDSVDKGKFVLDVYYIKLENQRIKAISIQKYTGATTTATAAASTSKFSGGSLAGLGLGMLVTGLLLGAVIVLLVRKLRDTGEVKGVVEFQK